MKKLPQTIVRFDETIRALWFVTWDGGNFLGAVNQIGPRSFTFDYRFRYDMGTADPFDGKDPKSIYHGSADDIDEPEMIRTFRKTTRALLELTPRPRWYERVRGDRALHEFQDEIMALPFTHMKTVSRE